MLAKLSDEIHPTSPGRCIHARVSVATEAIHDQQYLHARAVATRAAASTCAQRTNKDVRAVQRKDRRRDSDEWAR
jgi:hypothetical protein